VVLTLGDALKMECLRGSQVIAGHSGLGRPFRFVSVMEVPDIANWVSPDELLLTTGYPFRESPAILADILIQLHKKGLAGLGLKPGRFIGEVPPALLRIADELELPIIELPPDAQFDKIIQGLLTEIINRDYVLISRSQQIHQTFTDLVLEGGDLQDIAQALADLCFGEITITDRFGEPLAQAQPSQNTEAPKTPAERCVRPIQVKRRTMAWILLETWRPAIEEVDIVALERAATVVAMVVFREERARDVEKRRKRDFLNALVTREFASPAEATENAQVVGVRFLPPYAVVVVHIDSYADLLREGQSREDHSELEYATAGLFDLIWREVQSRAKGSLIWEMDSSRYGVLYPIRTSGTAAKRYLIEVCNQLRKQAKANIDTFTITITIGIGPCAPDVMGLPDAFEQARLAAEIGCRVFGPNGIHHYQDLGIYQLLANQPDQKVLRDFADTMLGPLLEYDKTKRTDLTLTLDAMLATDGTRKAAAKLYIHPKTLAFRKKRIEGVLDVSLQDPEVRLRYGVALKALQVTGDWPFGVKTEKPPASTTRRPR